MKKPPHADEITAPLPEPTVPSSPTWQSRPTMPLVHDAARARPVLPFRAPAPAVQQATPPPPRGVAPVDPPRRSRTGVYVAAGIALLALYSTVLVLLVAPRSPTRAPAGAPSGSSPPAPPLTTAPIPEDEGSMRAPSPATSASTAKPQASTQAACRASRRRTSSTHQHPHARHRPRVGTFTTPGDTTDVEPLGAADCTAPSVPHHRSLLRHGERTNDRRGTRSTSWLAHTAPGDPGRDRAHEPMAFSPQAREGAGRR